ncbi:MAG: molybdopterin-dependent oxidoreductase [Hyphomicrobiales bacterium]
MTTVQTNTTKTTCPYCGVGCGVLASKKLDGGIDIKGDPDHRANFGRLCSKGAALGETIDLDGRLLYPQINGTRSSWAEALELVAAKFSQVIAEHGPESVAFYVSGQILTEDYYVANKLMKGYIGSANIDTNSRLCMASSVAGHKRAFGSDTVPGNYEDLELADLVVLTGSNLAWCHPVIYQRIVAAKAANPEMKVVLIDPRRTMTADIADIHLAIASDGDVALFNGLLAYLAQTGATNSDYVEKHTNGFSEALQSASVASLEDIALRTGLSASQIESFYALWRDREKVVTVFSQGVNQSSGGTDKVNAIINCHLATGRIGKPGMGPFSITGQPNAMGGREVGGLANMLAAHMVLENAEHRDCVRRFWQSPTIADTQGLKAVDMFDAVADGRIKAIWIMATNPVDSMPNADAVEAALEACPFVVVSDIVAKTDTLRHAHVKLPSLGWGEKEGTVTNSERCISLQKAFLPAPGEATADWWQMVQVARRMGFVEGFSFENAASIFREYAAQTAFENNGTRDLDIGAYAHITDADYGKLSSFQWPKPASRLSLKQENRFFANGGFYTSNKRANFVAVTSPSVRKSADEKSFTLNTGRIRDQWHTMTRTSKSARLSSHIAEPFVEIHPSDATTLNIADADLVEVENKQGKIVVRALITDRVSPGQCFVPMHFTDQVAANARVDRLVSQETDPFSGQPALKSSSVSLARFSAKRFGFVVNDKEPALNGFPYWAIAKTDYGFRAEFAALDVVGTDEDLARKVLKLTSDAALLVFSDHKNGITSAASFDGPNLIGAVYLADKPVHVSRGWIADQLGNSFKDLNSRWRVAAGRPANDVPDKGAIICSCMGIGKNEISAAARGGCFSVSAIGSATGAGTNCGSCKSEIKVIINEHQLVAAE